MYEGCPPPHGAGPLPGTKTAPGRTALTRLLIDEGSSFDPQLGYVWTNMLALSDANSAHDLVA